ncbi:hypothetical protein HPB48_022729 [Haemaphysalis longicornis]|uniref:Tick transposon n=1 Tax=Haemaphysalis longicornis TaxID=44386 RepID=A0A9J6FDY0_HAELO|nr:hypothetical protein HPB48_022729 [Haemaphysalis longicornis]
MFLDLSLRFDMGHICWRHETRSSKGFLPHDSVHSKNVKRAIVTMASRSAIEKSCAHQMTSSFNRQVTRLRNAGYAESLLAAVSESLLQRVKGRNKRRQNVQRTKGNTVVVPYVHGFAHNLKKIAARQGVFVLCSAPNKAYQLCRRVNNEARGETCTTNHRTKYAECQNEVVYSIPLSCKKVYVGQTGRCINDRAREHAPH